MDFGFTAEQKALRETVRRYLNDKIAPIADDYDRRGFLTKQEALGFMQQLKPFGFVASEVPVELGGAGLDCMTYGILIEEIMRVYASLGNVFVIGNDNINLIARCDNAPLRDRILPGLVSGEKIICSAITEPDHGSDTAIETKAVLEGDYYRINGTKMWISNGSIADYVIVLAKTETAEGMIRILVERDKSPFAANDIHKLGLRSSPVSELVFEDCMVPKDNLINSAGGRKDTLKDLGHARIMVALASVGIAQAALEAAIQYAKERIQFKRPIASFQLIQSMIAEMATDLDAARLLCYRVCDLYDKGIPCRKEGSMAKAYATEMGIRVTSKAIQVHGAYGLADEYKVERFFRDCRVLNIPDGTTEIQNLIIGRELLGVQAFV